MSIQHPAIASIEKIETGEGFLISTGHQSVKSGLITIDKSVIFNDIELFND
jgi:hypothetical protein